MNYFDTSPVYCQGFSERATGAALKRYPREKLLIATKMSNFQNYTRENSIKMYHQSMKELQTDYLDYYLLHSVGGGEGIKTFHDRYIDNGVLAVSYTHLDVYKRQDVSNVLFSNGWIADDDGTVYIYYASSDTRMHVAVSTVDRLVDYCLHTPADGLRSAASVAAVNALIDRNEAFLNG